MEFRNAILVPALLLLASPAAAEIFRCVAPGGSVTYQQQPCDSGARDERIAREKELETERERARARAESVPIFIVGRPFRWRDTPGASGTPRSRPRT